MESTGASVTRAFANGNVKREKWWVTWSLVHTRRRPTLSRQWFGTCLSHHLFNAPVSTRSRRGNLLDDDGRHASPSIVPRGAAENVRMPFSGQTMNILIRERAPFPKVSSAAEQISYLYECREGRVTTRVRAISAAKERDRERERDWERTVSGGLILCGTRCRRIYTDTCIVNVIIA